jgi:phosphate transport system substrate-binding protein
MILLKENFMKPKAIFVFMFFVGSLLFSQDNNEPKIISDEVQLVEYQPFQNNQKLAVLEEETTLKLTADLPVLDGATALYPVYSAFVNAVYPRAYYHIYDSIVQCWTTSKAYDNLLEGKVDIIFCTEPSKYHLEKATELGVSFSLTPIGRDALVFFVNKNNPMENITSFQIKDIYSGEITNWKEITGIDENIIAYQRPENSGSQTGLQFIMGETPIMEPIKETIAGGMGEIINRVSSYRNYQNAIGFSFLFFTTEMVKSQEIKLLAIDGIIPSKKTIQNNTYPFSGLFYAITIGNEKENVKKLIKWILSEQGQYLIEKTGYVPIN